jgi:tetratricopeptide (TPR) repeat protein
MKRRLPGLGLFFLAGILCASPVLGQDAPGPSGRNRYSITGAVRDADTNQAAPDTLVELRQFDGPIIEQAYTSGNGNFAFSNLRQDTYELTIDRDGYEHFDQEITPTANVTLNVELQRSRGAAAPAGGNVVSARELSVPHKAHDAMEKGLALLYQKMDYPGSVEQFQRAIREYADYYEAYAQMGVAYVKMGDADQAEQSLRKSL